VTELPPKIEALIVPEHIIETSRRFLEPFRARGVEGCILWYGYPGTSGECFVATVVCPEQTNDAGCYSIPSESMRAVRQATRPHGLLLLTQIHTHPRSAFFSTWDAQNALNKRPGALNMIVADFGNVRWLTPGRFNIVELDPKERWRPWSPDDWRRLRLIPGPLDLRHAEHR
jgi:hypothetical protein